MNQSEVRFTADRMLGRLARLLRLLGYDTEYSPAMATSQLQEIARRGERIVLTRGQAEKRFPDVRNIFSVKSENAPRQLQEVVEHFRLDAHTGLWTRCTLCNGRIAPVEKVIAATLVPPKVFEVYDAFFRCGSCGHIYWQGSHVERILKNLASVLRPPGE